MRNLPLPIVIAALLISAQCQAWTLKVHGCVNQYLTGLPMQGATIKVYKNGIRLTTTTTGATGKYSFDLENGARYVFRFSAPGSQGKCFTVDTNGMVWEGEKGTKEVFVEMILFKRISGMDLSYFDLPMGMARFEPATGLVQWDREYDARIRSEVAVLMADYERRLHELGEAGRPQALASAGR
ncbi:MAG TPA: carboxypeptidase regulatory-like domain-containing protein [Flavobacteriales bacterium]